MNNDDNIYELRERQQQLQNELKELENEIKAKENKFVHRKDVDIKCQLESLLDAYGFNDAVKVVSRQIGKKTQYEFRFKYSRKLLKQFNADLGSRKLFNQANHFLRFITKEDVMFIKRERALYELYDRISVPNDLIYNIHYLGSSVDYIEFKDTENMNRIIYDYSCKKLNFRCKALPGVKCSVDLYEHRDVFAKVRYYRNLIG
jgi:hypothetical protein